MAFKVALTGGGTGGHIYPCLALAEVLREKNCEVFYIGNHNKLEAKLLDPAQPEHRKEYTEFIKFLPIEAQALPRSKNPFKWLKWIWDFGACTNTVKEYLKQNNINIVFGTGGYVAGPVFAAANLLKIPYVIHNLDANMGLANKFFLKDATALTLAFPIESLKPRNGNVFIVGNPISKKFLTSQKDLKLNDTEALRESFTQRLEESKQTNPEKEKEILITGGSQGAESINIAIAKILPTLSQKTKLKITHITGPKTYDDFIKNHIGENTYKNYDVMSYTHEMDKLCLKADIAVCRAGAMTIAEMAASSTVPIFVPLSWAANDHQNANAKALVDANAAFSIAENKLSDEEFQQELLNKLLQLIVDDELLAQMKKNLSAFIKPNSAEEIYELLSMMLKD